MLEEYKIDPEVMEFTDTYLSTLDVGQACKQLNISEEQGHEYMRKKEVKRFIDNVFLEQGYLNRFKMIDVLNKAIDSKLEEAEETGIYTKESLLELFKFMHQIRMDSEKLTRQDIPNSQVNIQNNSYGSNIGDLLGKIVK